MNAGVKVGDSKICLLLYADDVVVISESGEELQDMLDVVNEYGKDFGMNFSDDKSKVMIVNGTEEDKDKTWYVGARIIKQTDKYKYLGVWMSSNGCERMKNEKMSLINKWVGQLGSVARMRACKYDVLREVWKSVAVPSVMYGMEVFAWNESEINNLEIGQNRLARIALNAPRYAAVEALRGDMGWSTFRERIRKATVRFKVRLDWGTKGLCERSIYGV